MPKRKAAKPRRKKAPVRRRKPRRRLPKGGVKPSDVLGGISAAATGASALGFDAPITLPIAGITGIASGILRLFGSGGITPQQLKVIRRAQRQGLVIGKTPVRRKQPGLRPKGVRRDHKTGQLVRFKPAVQPRRRRIK